MYRPLALTVSASTAIREGPEVNKFEQVSSGGHQVSLAGDEARAKVPCPGGWAGREGGS